MAKYIRGIDVAAWEPNINWEKVCAQDIRYVFIKATQGDFADRLFTSHWNGAKRVGILRGAYHFIDPRLSGRVQAETFLRTVKLEPGDLPPVLDLEDLADVAPAEAPVKKGLKPSKPGKGGKPNLNTSGIPNAQVIDCAQTWLSIVEKETGRKPILYSSPSYLESRLRMPNGKLPAWAMSHVLWIANYLNHEVTENDLPLQPKGWSPWTIWQYSDKGLLDGILTEDGTQTTRVDLNFFRGTLEELYTLAGAKVPEGVVVGMPKVGVTEGSKQGEVVIPTPPVIPVPQPQPQSNPSQYMVKSGDTLFAIALRFHTTVDAILTLNPQITNANLIRVGDILNIPQ
jgi:GH25 family lysozyme M1 (1,4-beta-N-acetylmuramidase)